MPTSVNRDLLGVLVVSYVSLVIIFLDFIGVCNIRSLEKSLVRNGQRGTGSRHHESAIEPYKCLHDCCIGVGMVCADHIQEM